MKEEDFWAITTNKLIKFIGHRVANYDIAKDIAQDTLLKVHKKFGSLEQPTLLNSWIYQICRNTIIDYYRQKNTPTKSIDDIEIHDTNFEKKYFRSQLNSCVFQMVEKLPSIYRQAIYLTEYKGYSQKELSIFLELSISGTKSRIQRARKILQNDLLTCCRFEIDPYGNIIDYRLNGSTTNQ